MVDSEIYTGIYSSKIQIKIERPSIVVERPYVSTSAKVDNRITICVEDSKNSFWPCIIRLTENEAKRLIEMLEKAILHTDKESQFYEELK